MGFLAILSVLALLGCRPSAGTSGTREIVPEKRSSPKSDEKAPAKQPTAEVPVKAPPGVGAPMKKLPDPQGADTPVSATCSRKLGASEAGIRKRKQVPPASTSEPSLEPAVKWLPKPAANPAAEANRPRA